MTFTNIEEAFEASFFLLYILETCIAVMALAYAVTLACWTAVWRRRPEDSCVDSQPLKVSVVVALHNEAEKVVGLMESLRTQSKAADEVIMVCDHCTDDTERIIEDYLGTHGEINVRMAINEGRAGKKAAQRKGVEMARNEYVAVVDGDCRVGERWMEKMSAVLSEKRCDLLIMPVAMKANDATVSQRLMEMEFVSLQLATAATAISGKATMCNGANMAFRRDVYMSHVGNDEYVSGDDMFLLSEVKRQGGKVEYLKSGDVLVVTDCPPGVSSYYRQRTRWLRKASGYTDNDVKRLAVLVAMGNASWPLACVVVPMGVMWLAVACFAVKTLAEMILLWNGRKVWGMKWNASYIVLLALVYPFVLLSIAILTLFRNKKKW